MHDKRRVSIFIDGVNRGNGNEIYWSLVRFIQSKQISTDQFDLKATAPSNNHLLFSSGEPTSPFSAFRSDDIYSPMPHDLRLVTPSCTDKYFLPQKYTDCRLLFSTASRYYFPNYNLMFLVSSAIASTKRYINYFSKAQIFGNEELQIKIITYPDYYLFEQK